MSYQSHHKKKIKLIHISTDGVYPSTKGNYFENSKLKPYLWMDQVLFRNFSENVGKLRCY